MRRERRALEVQLRHAQRMEAVGRLASGIAHDFRNLLTAVTGYSELLHRAARPARSACARRPRTFGAPRVRAPSLTGQLLTFSRRHEPSAAVLDLNVLVTDMERMLRRLIGEHIELTVTLAPGDSRVTADRGQMEQVIMNLVVNARDAMPGRRPPLADDRARRRRRRRTSEAGAGAAPGPYVSLDVQDTGHGMDEADAGEPVRAVLHDQGPVQGHGPGPVAWCRRSCGRSAAC